LIADLFAAMADGGHIFIHPIRHFNGSLFDNSPILELTADEIRYIQEAAKLDWSSVDPSIFGILFQRGLDPAMRVQLGAQYTSRDDIEALIEPVVMQPLEREWDQTRTAIDNLLRTSKPHTTGKEKPLSKTAIGKAYRKANSTLRRFHERLATVKVLDPACGSGNFLYVTLQKLKDLEKRVLIYAGEKQLHGFLPQVGPWQFYGIEINPYAFELAQTTLWIGYLQWIRANGFGEPAEPILRAMDNFKNADAILDLAEDVHPKEPEWPEVDFIVGNPPFLGGSKIWRELGRTYQKNLWRVYANRVPRGADLVTYWFEKSRRQIENGAAKRVGLLATQAIRGGANREVLKHIKATGDIFFAESDRDWVLDGAAVHISMIAFDDGSQKERFLNGVNVVEINADLASGEDTTSARVLSQNIGISFRGDTKGGAFDIGNDSGLAMLHSINPHGRPNSDVIYPWINGLDVLRRPRGMFTISFGADMTEEAASLYERPFQHVRNRVLPERLKSKRESYRQSWWIHMEPRPE
jgi:type II restriction/modification system DNA methylase subunit YeeA